jgi:FdhD protein
VNEQGLREHCRIHLSENAHGEPQAEVQIPPEYICEQYVARRAVASSTSCGICGRESLDDLAALDLVRPPQQPFDPTTLADMHRQIAEHQVVFGLTGGTHAAAAFDTRGELLVVAEDVGRHNAVDKVIGLLIDRDIRTSAEVLWVSGRTSFEIVLKACRAGIPVLSAVSSPTSLAIETARSVGISLLGFCREDRATLFCGAEHILGPVTEQVPTGAAEHD